jgi:nicotinate dehydrogenase subunit B
MTNRNPDNRPEADTSLFERSMSRRQFIRRMGVLGGGIVIYSAIGPGLSSARTAREGFLGAGIPTDFNAFLRIGSDGQVTCLTGKIEMGQGPITSLPQMLADELDVPYSSVDIIMGDTDLCPWDAGTFGSLTTRHFGVFLREAAAEAKGVLKEMARDYLKCPVEGMLTRDGFVVDAKKPDRRVSYGRLTKGKIIEKHLASLPPLKNFKEFTVMGKSFGRRDARAKVTGEAKFSADIRLPGMLYARILRPPAHGATLEKVDLTPAAKVQGARIVRDGDLIAALHERPEEADRALALIKTEYKRPESGVNDSTIFGYLLKNAPPPEIASENGSLEAGRNDAVTRWDETYLNSYVAHSPMEPHAALAEFKSGRMTVWASTQTPFRVRQTLSQRLNLPEKDVRVITPFVGGGFGGKSASRQAAEAAILARKTGRPVQVAWNRREEFFYDTFRPAAVVKIASGLDAAGRISYWDYKVYFAGQRGCELFYDVPNHREAVHGRWRGGARRVHPFGVGPWRAPANNTNTYARELQMNLMAAKAGIDPLLFRLNHLKDNRMIRVLKAAADAFGYTPAATPSKRGCGIACGIDAGTYVACLAEIEVERPGGAVQVKRVVCAQDMGFVVNPEGARLQVEGCITMGLGYCLSEEIRFRDGEILDTNFDTYSIPRFSWLPRIQVVFVKNDDLAPQGGGEPAIITMGAVVATAIYDATGAVLYRLPMTPDRVRKALGKA